MNAPSNVSVATAATAATAPNTTPVLTEKQCTKCKAVLPADAFSKVARNKTGLHSWCKPCVNACTAAWHQRNKPKRQAQKRAWYKAHPDVYKAERQRVWQRHREKYLKWHKDYRAQNGDAIRQRDRDEYRLVQAVDDGKARFANGFYVVWVEKTGLFFARCVNDPNRRTGKIVALFEPWALQSSVIQPCQWRIIAVEQWGQRAADTVEWLTKREQRKRGGRTVA